MYLRYWLIYEYLWPLWVFLSIKYFGLNIIFSFIIYVSSMFYFLLFNHTNVDNIPLDVQIVWCETNEMLWYVYFQENV